MPLAPDRVFVYGGDGEGGRRSDAATIDLVSGETELIASEAPFPDPVGEVGGVLAGDHVVLLGILCGELDAEDIDPCRPGTPAMVDWSVIDGTWRNVDIPEAAAGVVSGWRHVAGSTADGRAVVQLGPYDDPSRWTYQPSTGEWTRLPDPGAFLDRPCMTGATLVGVSSAFHDQPGNIDADNERDLARSAPYLALLDLSSEAPRWRTTEATPAGAFDFGRPQVDCLEHLAMTSDGAGGHALVHGVGVGDTGWSPVASEVEGSVFLDVVTVGEVFVFIDTNRRANLAIDPVTGEIGRLAPAPIEVTSPVWTGAHLVAWPLTEATTPVILDS